MTSSEMKRERELKVSPFFSFSLLPSDELWFGGYKINRRWGMSLVCKTFSWQEIIQRHKVRSFFVGRKDKINKAQGMYSWS